MRNWVALAMLLCATGVATAAEGPLDSARRCATVQDSLKRLVCYDRVFAAGEPAATLPAGAAPVVPAPPVAVPAPAAVQPPPATVPPAVDTAFGGEMVKRSIEERETSAGPRSLTAKVTALRETRPSVFRITLDNGQIWQQMDKDGLFYVEVGDDVQIDRGSMGGYRMARTSQGRSGWVRVNRIK